MRTRVVLIGVLLFLVGALSGCSSHEGSSPDSGASDGASLDVTPSEGSSPDASTDARVQDAAVDGTSLDGASLDGDADESSPYDSSPRDGGTLCLQGGVFRGSATYCNGQMCPAGCACIARSPGKRNVACMCARATDADGASTCITPNCGTIVCEAPLECSQNAQSAICNPPEGPDASALDGGSLCSIEAGAFPGTPGTCGNQACGAGGACVATTSGGACFYAQAEASSSGGALCIAPDCGNIFCKPGCSCVDMASGACRCSESPDGGACVDIDVSTYDTSCHGDSDCINVTAGTICEGYNCICGGAAINADGQSRYNMTLSSIHPGRGPACGCPYLGAARCVQGPSGGVCTYCPSSISGAPIPPGCPDGG
jgi:hypothetical protein